MPQTNLTPQQSPLKVVPPIDKKPEIQAPLAPPETPTVKKDPAPTQTQSGSGRKWLILGAIVLAGGAISCIPIPHYVTGEAVVNSREEERQSLVAPEGGIITINVRQNDTIEAGDIVATIESADIESRISEAERYLVEAKGALDAAQQRAIVAQSNLSRTQTAETLARNNYDRSLEETSTSLPNSLEQEREIQGVGHEIAGLQDEIDGMYSEIAGVESEIIGLEGEIASLEEQLQTVDESLANRLELARTGAIARQSMEITNLRLQKSDLQREVGTKRSQIQLKYSEIDRITSRIARTEDTIAQRESHSGARSARILEVDRQANIEANRYRDELEMRVAERQTTEEEVAAAEAEVRYQGQLISQWERELKDLNDRKNNLTLKARTGGTVLTEDLDLLDGTHVEAGEKILSLADLEQLTATVRIRQEDKNLVEKGQFVAFQPPDLEGPEYGARVEGIGSRINATNPGEKPMLTVMILVDNEDDRLLPGAEGHAHIRTGKMPIYKKVQHELGKLFNLRKYFPWLSSDRAE